MNRRGFFSSVLGTAGGKNIAKPFLPYINDISALKTVCPSCNAPCVDSCEKSIIVLSEDIPKLDFSKSGCTFCKKCANACDKGVLDQNLVSRINAEFAIKTKECLSWNGTMCYTCKDVCKEKAISFFGVFRPAISSDICTGCGECVSICKAITVKPSKEYA